MIDQVLAKLVKKVMGVEDKNPTTRYLGRTPKAFMSDGDYNALKDGISVIPFIGPAITYVMDLFDGEYRTSIDDEDDEYIIKIIDDGGHAVDYSIIQEMLDDALSGLSDSEVKYLKQYQVDPAQIQAARKYINEVTKALAQTDLNISQAQRKFDDITAHVNDYLNGVQRQAMRNAKQGAEQDLRALEKDRATQSEKLANAERIVQTASDLSLTPVTDENDSVVSKIASDLTLNVSAVRPKEFAEVRNNEIQENK